MIDKKAIELTRFLHNLMTKIEAQPEENIIEKQLVHIVREVLADKAKITVYERTILEEHLKLLKQQREPMIE